MGYLYVCSAPVVYPSVSGGVASDAGDAGDVAKDAEQLVNLPPRLDYCNVVVLVDVVRARVAQSVRLGVGAAQRRDLRRTYSRRPLIQCTRGK